MKKCSKCELWSEDSANNCKHCGAGFSGFPDVSVGNDYVNGVMLDFIRSSYRFLIEVTFWIILILSAILGWYIGHKLGKVGGNDYTFIGVLLGTFIA